MTPDDPYQVTASVDVSECSSGAVELFVPALCVSAFATCAPLLWARTSVIDGVTEVVATLSASFPAVAAPYFFFARRVNPDGQRRSVGRSLLVAIGDTLLLAGSFAICVTLLSIVKQAWGLGLGALNGFTIAVLLGIVHSLSHRFCARRRGRFVFWFLPPLIVFWCAFGSANEWLRTHTMRITPSFFTAVFSIQAFFACAAWWFASLRNELSMLPSEDAPSFIQSPPDDVAAGS